MHDEASLAAMPERVKTGAGVQRANNVGRASGALHYLQSGVKRSLGDIDGAPPSYRFDLRTFTSVDDEMAALDLAIAESDDAELDDEEMFHPRGR